MSRTISRFILTATVGTALAVGGLVATPGVAHAATGVVVTHNVDLLIRSRPTQSSAKIGSIPSGTKITLLCKIDGTQISGTQGVTSVWNKVSYGTKTGYISAAYVRGGTSSAVKRCPSNSDPSIYPVNPHNASWGSNGGYTPRSKWLKGQIESRFPGVTCNTYQTSDKRSDHRTGNAIDCWGTLGKRRAVATWVAGGLEPLKTNYVIHEQKIFSMTHPYWKQMEDRGSETANHFDHIHISLRTPKHG